MSAEIDLDNAHANVAQAMREYGQAIRGDWSDLDGRSVRAEILDFADEIENPKGHTLAYWRDDLGLCPDGNGHWAGRWGYCTKETCPIGWGEANDD